MRRLLPLLVLPVLLLSGCATPAPGSPSGSPGASSGGPSSDGPIPVVAATDVYGDIVEQIGGGDVAVTSIVNNPKADPHEYEATSRDQLAVSRAKLVVVNGGGYDDFFERLLSNVSDKTVVLDATKESGLNTEPAEGEFNEHLWYNLPVVSKVSAAIADRLGTIEPSKRADFQSGLQAFQGKLKQLEDQEAQIKPTAEGMGVAITEPVPLYLTGALGMVNRTPDEFSEAIEEGDDVAPAVLQQQLDLFREKKVALLAYNEQTADTTTEQVLKASNDAKIPVVGVRETLPEGQDYLEWIGSDLDAISAALKG